MGSLVVLVLLGLLVGSLAKLLGPDGNPGGTLMTMSLGVGGAMLGGLVGPAGGWYQPVEPTGFVMAATGAVLLLLAYRRTHLA